MVPRRSGYSLRELRSGRWQVLLPDPETGRFRGHGSYADKEAAERAGQLAAVEQHQGSWVDPRRGDIALGDYMASWLASRKATGRHGDRYGEEAARIAEKHITPTLGRRPLIELRPPVIRAWYDGLVARRVVATGAAGLVPAKAYRLLSAVLGQAARDELIPRNPCTIERAGVEQSPERKLLEPEQVQELADAMGERWHAMVLVAGWCGLRFGELVALRRRHIDLLHRTIRVDGAVVRLQDGTMLYKAPKTAAGRRTVTIPAPLVQVLEVHLDRFAEQGADGYVFVGPKGGLPTSANFGKLWRKARDEVGVDASFHDLRHAAGTMFAQTGATTREIQGRLGHASRDAADRYQHAAQRREQELADRLAAMMPEGGLAHRSRKRPPAPKEIGRDQR